VLGSSTIHNLNQKLSKCERNILKVYKALLEMDRKVNVVLKSCRRQALPVHRRTSTALLNSRKQVIRGSIHNINTTESFTLLASSFDNKGSLEVLLSTTTSFTLSAAATSPTMLAAATSFTLQVAVASFTLAATATASTVPAAAASPTVSAAATSFTLQVAAASFTLGTTAMTSTVPAAANNGDPSKAKFKCGVANIKTKHLKRRWEQIAGQKGDRGRGVSQPQNPTLFRHKRIKQRDETQYILPDDDVAYSSRAVTYLSEIGVGGSLSDGQHYNLPLARRRMLCQQC
jgi:hypothetical protein